MENEKKKKLTILGTSIWRLLAYFIIYSFVGYIIETVFAMVFYNVIESRKSFLYGPFCSIYGVGAVFMYVILTKYFKKNNHLLFLGGILVGSIVEYIISFIGEVCFHVRWWDYSHRFLNINGRICLLYSIFWGLLAVYFMKVINPKIDKFLDFIKTKLNIKFLKTVTLIIIILLFIDFIISYMATHWYLTRQIVENNLDIVGKEKVVKEYNKIYSNESLTKFIYKYFNDEKMVLTYPNLTVNLNDGRIVKVREFLPNIIPYYYKFK